MKHRGMLKQILALTMALMMILSLTQVSLAQEAEKEKLVVAIQTYNYITDYDENYLTKRLEEALGIEIEFYLLSADSSEATTQLSLMISTNQKLPDIICTGSLSAEAILNYGSKGVFVDLTDYLGNPDVMPNFTAIESEENKAAMIKDATSADGKIYSLVQYNPVTWNMTPFRMYINQAWLDTLGLDMPKTTEEYYEVLKAFKTLDPNGNGVSDEIPVYGFSAGTYGENITIPLMNSFIYYPATTISATALTLDDSGTKVIAPFAQEAWRAGLEYMHKLCAEGLLPEAVFTDDKTQFMAVLNNEEVNLVGSLSSGSLSRWNSYDTSVNGQQYEMLAPLQGPEGFAYTPYIQYNSAPIWFVTSSCQNPELAVKLGDMFFNNEFTMIARFGEEGVDWTKDEAMLNDPQYSNAYIEAGIYEKPSYLVLNDIWAENNAKIWRNMNPAYMEIADSDAGVTATQAYDPTVKSFKFYADNFAYNYSAHPEHLLPKLNYTSDEATAQAETIVNISTYVAESMAQFITGARPLNDREWSAYLSELDMMGLQTWLQNAQAAFERQ